MAFAGRVLSTTAGRVVLVAVAAAVLALAWWLASPVFLSKTVDEQFPLTVDATVPENMTRAEVEAVMEGMAMVDAPMSEAMMPGMAEATAVKMGTFQGADRFHKGSGPVTIYRLEDGSHVLRLEDFQVTNGPDLRVILSPHADPQGAGDVTAEGYVELGKLKGNIGNQNYPIDAGVDVSTLNSVVIYCKPFRVIFAVAGL